MTEKIKEISSWFLEQGIGITRDVLNDKLQEAYMQGKMDANLELIDSTVDNIRYNTMRDISIKKKELYEKNFYNTPSEEDVIEMKVYEYLSENLPNIIKAYKGDK